MTKTKEERQPPNKPPSIILGYCGDDDSLREVADRIMKLNEEQRKILIEYLKKEIG